jgi:HK97 family phage major capsid protein
MTEQRYAGDPVREAMASGMTADEWHRQQRGAAGQRGGKSPTPPVNSGEYAALYEQFLRRGGQGMPEPWRAAIVEADQLDRELRDGFVTTTDNIGGFASPPDFVRRLFIGLKRGSGIMRAATVVPTARGEAAEFPLYDDTGVSGEIITEAGAHTLDTATPFASRALKSYGYSSRIVKVSMQLAQDSAFPLMEWLPRVLGARIGRAFNAHASVGTGAGAQPAGIVPAATVGVTGIAGQVATITYAALVDLIGSVDADYLEPDGVSAIGFMGRGAALTMIRKGLAESGADVVTVDAEGWPRVLGYRFFTNRDVPAPGASARSLLFGNFSAGVLVRRATSANSPAVIRLSESYAAGLQVGWLGFERLDSVQADAAALRASAHPAS